jgi:hypothetical protein
MKAERRHDLKTNTLARGLETLPEASRQHGTKVMVAVLAVLLIAFLIRQRIISGREKEAYAAYSVTETREVISQLDEAFGMGSPQSMATLRQEVATRAEEKVRQVLETTDDPRLIAEAKLARGDLNWKLANFPELPGAATQPSLQFPRSRKDLLQTAAGAYQEVLDDPTSPPESMRTARFGLAAVYENQREWDKAKEQYQRIVNDAATPQPFKDQAVDRLNALDDLRRPPLLAAPATAPTSNPTTTTSPSTAPATTGASTQASTTRAATSPSSKPASAPAPALAPK